MSSPEERNSVAIRETLLVISEETASGVDVIRDIANNWSFFDNGPGSWKRHILEEARRIFIEQAL